MKKLSVAILAATLLSLTACGGTSPAAKTAGEGGLTPIKVGVITITDAAAAYVGVDQRFFEEEGLKAELVPAQGGAAIVPLVVSGGADFGFSNVTSLIIGRSKGLPLQIVSAGNATTGIEGKDFADVLVKGGSGIEDAADLVGKKIAVNTLNNISDTTVRAAIEAAGADGSNVTFVEMPFPDMRAALEKGNVDAVATVEPFRSMILEDKTHSAVSNYATPLTDLMVTAYFTSEQVAAQKPEVVEAFKRAMSKSLKYSDEHPDAVRKILPEFTAMDADLVNRIVLPRFPSQVNRDSVNEVAELALKNGLIDKLPDMEKFIP
jgi:NitT/TauT family transport system substrate-binding protein